MIFHITKQNLMQTLTKISKAPKRGKLVTTAHVNELVSNYKKERWIQNSQKLGKVDSLSTWYGLDELQSFLQLARHHQADGVKMYYGVYGSDLEETPELQGRQTVVLVATKQKNVAGKMVNKEVYTHNNGKPEILAFNFGAICPPTCGTNEPPDGDNGFGYGFDMSSIGVSIIEKNGEIIIL
jgi:hypothetical protein